MIQLNVAFSFLNLQDFIIPNIFIICFESFKVLASEDLKLSHKSCKNSVSLILLKIYGAAAISDVSCFSVETYFNKYCFSKKNTQSIF